MNIQEQKKAIGDSYSVAAMALRGFQASQGLPIDSVDEISLMRSGADDCQLEVLNAFATLFDTLQRFQDELGEEKDEDADEAALKELNEELRELMELQGFTHWQTGGGCTAWGKHLLGGNDNAAPYMMITVSEDATAYFYDLAEAHKENAICIYLYNPEGDPMNGGGLYYSWDEFKENFKGGF